MNINEYDYISGYVCAWPACPDISSISDIRTRISYVNQWHLFFSCFSKCSAVDQMKVMLHSTISNSPQVHVTTLWMLNCMTSRSRGPVNFKRIWNFCFSIEDLIMTKQKRWNTLTVIVQCSCCFRYVITPIHISIDPYIGFDSFTKTDWSLVFQSWTLSQNIINRLSHG